MRGVFASQINQYTASTSHVLPEAHPAHALLSVAHALLCPANTIAQPKEKKDDYTVLPIDEIKLPTEDVSDLKDVVDAINRLCDDMKTSSYDDQCFVDEASGIPITYEQSVFLSEHGIVLPQCVEETEVRIEQNIEVVEPVYIEPVVATPQYQEIIETKLVSCEEVAIQKVETYSAERWSDTTSLSSIPSHVEDVAFDTEKVQNDAAIEPVVATPQYQEIIEPNLVSCEEVAVQKVETYSAERWSDSTSQLSIPSHVEDVASDTEKVQNDAASDMYYTASSEVSLVSDLEGCDKQESVETSQDGKECVIAGHVAAMRERFENMTRSNTPCFDLARSLSPSLDAIRNMSPSPNKFD